MSQHPMMSQPKSERHPLASQLAEADRTILRYKLGRITREQATTILVRDCAIPEDVIDKAFEEADATPLPDPPDGAARA